MLPRPFVPFQVSFTSGGITPASLREKLNNVVLNNLTPANYLDFEVRLGAIGVWELTTGNVSLNVYDPISVVTDLTADQNALYTVTDFPAKNKWAHVYYKYKPEVHARSIRLDEATSTVNFFSTSTDAAGPKVVVQLFGSWRVV
jgi:hypothetical protein